MILDYDVTFGAAEESDVKIDPQCKGGAEGYIYDGATLVLDSPINWIIMSRPVQPVLMSLFIIFRPLYKALEPIKRLDPVSIQNILAEGSLKEIINFLGWIIDSRRFIIVFPIEKLIACSESISQLQTKLIVSY